MKKENIHLVSDSTGETLGSICRAVMSQFNDIEIIEKMWSLVRTESKMLKIIEEIKEQKGIVLYTILDENLLKILKKECKKHNISIISALGTVTEEFSKHFGKNIINQSGRQHVLDEEYFDRIEAINFTINHDDGRNNEDINKADIILVGPSRTSKSPTCIYLSHKGYKVANVPFILGIEMPKSLEEVKKPFIVGLTINTEALIQIRENRIKLLNSNFSSNNNDYLDIEKVQKEILAAKRYYLKNNWLSLDVTRRSVEETAAFIIQKYEALK